MILLAILIVVALWINLGWFWGLMALICAVLDWIIVAIANNS